MDAISFTEEQYINMSKCFGREFVQGLPSRLEDYAERWQLSDLKLIEYYSVNCLFSCRSDLYGDCVLKIFGCGYEFYIDEIKILTGLEGRYGYVRAYGCDEEHGALLLERIVPGTALKMEPSIDKRLSVFVDAWKNVHFVPQEPHSFKTYLDMTYRAFKAPWACGEIPELRKAARDVTVICRDLFDRYPDRVLLHADLHGDNLLKNSHGGYTIVDPHGRIGPPICDLGRYIANEFVDAGEDDRIETAWYVIKELSKRLDLPEFDIMRAFYVDFTLMNCWDAEDGPVNLDNFLLCRQLLREYS
jgi:streptomycin 6-kinase